MGDPCPHTFQNESRADLTPFHYLNPNICFSAAALKPQNHFNRPIIIYPHLTMGMALFSRIKLQTPVWRCSGYPDETVSGKMVR